MTSFHWIVEVNKKEDFQTSLATEDLPINSNVMILSEGILGTLDIWDVYRPMPDADLRSLLITIELILMFMMLRIDRYHKHLILNFERMLKWGIWSSGLGLESLSVDKWMLRRDLTGVSFSSSTRHILPFVKVLDVDRNSPPPGYKVTLSLFFLLIFF